LTFATGVFRDQTNSSGLSSGNDNNWASTSRVTGLPVYQDDEAGYRIVHLGAAFSQRLPLKDLVKYDVSA